MLYEGPKVIRGLINNTASYKWYASIGPSVYEYTYDDVTVAGPKDEDLGKLYNKKIEDEVNQLEAIKLEKIKKILDSEAEAG